MYSPKWAVANVFATAHFLYLAFPPALWDFLFLLASQLKIISGITPSDKKHLPQRVYCKHLIHR